MGYRFKNKQRSKKDNQLFRKRFQKELYSRRRGFSESVYEQVEKYRLLVGHNVLGFDIYLLRNWYRKYGKNYDDLPYKNVGYVCWQISYSSRVSDTKTTNAALLDFQMKMINIRKKGLRTSLGALGKSNGI